MSQFDSFDPLGQIGPPPGVLGDPLALDLPGVPRRRRRKKSVPEITQGERQSILGNVMGGLEYLGNLIDKPAAAYRGSLSWLTGGEAGGGLLNLIPFSDTLGITDPKERVYHRDIFEDWGLAPENEPGFHPIADPEDAFWDTASFAADAIFDPLVLARGPTAALTPAGRAIEKSTRAMNKLDDILPHMDDLAKGIVGPGRQMGLSPAGMVKEMQEGYRGFAALKIPFVDEPLAVFGAKKGTLANTFGTKALDWLYYGAGSPIPYVRQLLSKSVAGLPGGAAQRAKDLALSEMGQLGAAVTDTIPILGRELSKLDDSLKGMLEYARLAGDNIGFGETQELMRYLLEHKDVVTKKIMSQPQIKKMFDLGIQSGNLDESMVTQWADNAYDVIKTMQGTKDIIANRVEALGGNMRWLNDLFVEHFPRRPSNRIAREAWDLVAAKRLLPGANIAARRDIFRGIPEGALTLNRLSREELLTGPLRGDDLKKALRLELFNVQVNPQMNKAAQLDLWDELGQKGIKELRRQLIWDKYLGPAAIRDEADDWVVGWLRDGIDVDDSVKTILKQADADVKAGKITQQQYGTIIDALPKSPLDPNKVLTESLPSQTDELIDYFVRVRNKESALRKAGVEFQSIRETGLFDRSVMSDWMDYSNHLTEAVGNLQSAHFLLRRTATMATGDDPGKIPLREAWEAAKTKKGFRILSDTGFDTFLKDYAKANNVPPGQVAGLADNLMVDAKVPQVISAYVETMRPATQHWLGARWDDWTKVAKTYWSVPWPSFHVRNLVDGTWRNMARAGSDTYSMPAIMKSTAEAVQYVFSRGRSGSDDFLRYADEFYDIGASSKVKGFVAELTGELPGAVAKPASKWTAIDPLAVTQGRQNLLAKWGSNMYGTVEDLNRLPSYVAARRAGKTPAQAKHLVDHIQFDYSKGVKNSFEWQMKKYVPFWGFVSNNLPYQLGQLINRPGGGHAQTLRLISAMHRTSGEDLPIWLRERMSMRNPLDPGSEDSANVIRQFGLSIEDLSDFTFQSGLPSARTLERLLSRAHPGVTTPFKLFGGRDPYTGRPTEQMHGLTGIKWLDTLIYSSPASRGLTTYEMLAHPKKSIRDKAIDFLTGVKIGTYDLPKQRLYELQRLVEQRAKADPDIWSDEYFFVPQHKKDTVSKKTENTLEELKRLVAGLQRLRRQRHAE